MYINFPFYRAVYKDPNWGQYKLFWVPGPSDAFFFGFGLVFWARPLSGPPENARLECCWRTL